MARPKKKTEPIVSLGNEDKLLVQKSKPLFALWQSNLTLAEFKILDIYLGRINSRDDNHRTVRFEKGEIENILGIKQLKSQTLDDRLRHLMTTVRIPDDSGKRGFVRISLFEKAIAEQDDYGLWQVELTCTESARKYIFNVDEINYLRYKLKSIINIKSRYSYIMFLYLWDNKYRVTWEISLEDLKKLLKCDQEETYKEFKFFNRDILKRIQKELIEKTECRYTYEPIKKGRTVVAIRFTLEPLPKIEIDENQLSLPDPSKSPYEDKIEFLQGAVTPTGSKEPEFNKEQMRAIIEVLATIPDYKFPKNVPTGDIEFQQYHFLAMQYATMNARDTKAKPIKNRFAYLLKMLKTEAGV